MQLVYLGMQGTLESKVQQVMLNCLLFIQMEIWFKLLWTKCIIENTLRESIVLTSHISVAYDDTNC